MITFSNNDLQEQFKAQMYCLMMIHYFHYPLLRKGIKEGISANPFYIFNSSEIVRLLWDSFFKLAFLSTPTHVLQAFPDYTYKANT